MEVNNHGTFNKLSNYLVIVALLIIYSFDSIGLINIFGYNFAYYKVSSFIWLLFCVYLWNMPEVRSKAKLKYKQNIYWWAFNLGIIYIFIYFFSGFIDGFGRSPYSHTFLGSIQNIFNAGIILLGREMARNHLLNNITKKDSKFYFLFIVTFMTIINIPIKKFIELEKTINVIIFIAEVLGPSLAINLMATYLVYLNGTRSSLIYLGIIEAVHWLSPILPDLQWITAGFIGIITPLFSYLIIQYMYDKNCEKVKQHESAEDGPFEWILTSIISIFIIWFSVGVFPIYPSVIATGSMEPMIKPGDIILVEKITDIEDINKLNVNDVIQFKKDNILISHRVIVVGNNKEGIYYITKGDNNSTPDSDKVKPEQIKGKVINVIPKIGWPTLLLKMDKDINIDDIEF